MATIGSSFPVDVPVGSICKINSLVITDTFGVRTLIPSIERSAHPASSRWRMFKNSGNADAPTIYSWRRR